MDINVVGFLPPTERGLRPQFLLKVVLAQIKRDHRRAVFYRRTHKGVLVYLRDSRRKLHLHGHRHLVWLKYCVASSGLSMVVAEQSTEAFPPHHMTRLTTHCPLRRDESVGETLMIALGASIMASATPFCFCTTQKHLSVKI